MGSTDPVRRPQKRPLKARLSNWLIVGLAAIAGLVVMLTPLGDSIDRIIAPARFGLVQRAASGKVVIVEMDARSAAVIRRWPWSRTNYAAVVDRLRQAGAASVVFDVDVSSPSDAAGDAAFADALARADGLVALPTFGQDAGTGDRRVIDALPIPSLRPHVALASVNVQPDRDGQVRSMLFGTVTAATARPSLAAYIAQRSGRAGAAFPLDMSIDPNTIPRISFIDVRDGRFNPSLVRGRSILIGATAIEMGDRYGTPLWGVIPGVVVQAVAAETLLRGVPISGSPLWPWLAAVAALIGLVRLRRDAATLEGTVAALIALVAAVMLAQDIVLVTIPLAAAASVLLLGGAGCGFRNVSRRLSVQRTIDEATGLPNRRSLLDNAALAEAVTLVVLQIDNHDDLLAVLGSRRVADLMVRVADRLMLLAENGQVYRTTDRHLALMMPFDDPIEDRFEGLRAILQQPIEVAGRRVDVAGSLGVAAGNVSGAERLLVDAARAADEAARNGEFWRRSAEATDVLERSISLMGELDAGLSSEQVQVFYQPKYHVGEQRITSAEALVRWRHPDHGFIGPDTFIPLAEKTNRIGPLTLHVLRRVIEDLAGWRVANPDLTVAVNISAKLLSDASFNAAVEDALVAAPVPTTALVFEVTESAAMLDPTIAVAALRRYRDLGIGVSMDDYGTGQSTLTYLKQLPLNELKIDRSFVQHAHMNRADGVLVRSTIQLAHELGLKVVAEGVEDRACLTFLEECRCDLIQGYYISRPVPAAQFVALLAKKDTAAA